MGTTTMQAVERVYYGTSYRAAQTALCEAAEARGLIRSAWTGIMETALWVRLISETETPGHETDMTHPDLPGVVATVRP